MSKFTNALRKAADKVDSFDIEANKAKAKVLAEQAKAKALEGYDKAVEVSVDATAETVTSTKRAINTVANKVEDRTRGEITTF